MFGNTSSRALWNEWNSEIPKSRSLCVFLNHIKKCQKQAQAAWLWWFHHWWRIVCRIVHSIFEKRVRGAGKSYPNIISLKVFLISFCWSQLLHKSDNLSFTITNINNYVTDLCGNWPFQNDIENILCETKSLYQNWPGWGPEDESSSTWLWRKSRKIKIGIWYTSDTWVPRS